VFQATSGHSHLPHRNTEDEARLVRKVIPSGVTSPLAKAPVAVATITDGIDSSGQLSDTQHRFASAIKTRRSTWLQEKAHWQRSHSDAQPFGMRSHSEIDLQLAPKPKPSAASA
jgi:hypothetical protein